MRSSWRAGAWGFCFFSTERSVTAAELCERPAPGIRMPRERRTAGAPLRNAKRKKKRGGGARSTAVTAVTAAAAASSSSAPPRAVLPVHARASPSARSSSSSSSAAAAAARRRGCGAQRAATTCGGCARIALRARLLLLLAVAAHVAYGGWFLRGFDGLHPDGISGLLRLRGGSALATVERSFEFEDSTEAEEQSEMSASMEAASMASLFTSFCESVANGDASGIAKVKNTMIEELSHSSGETLAKLQSRSPDFLCELARWVSIEPYKRFLISQRSEGDGSPNPDTLSFENIKNTALVLLSKMVQMPIETLQEMSIYQRGEIFRMISTFTMQYFTMVRHAQIFKAGASTDTNLRSFLLEMGVTGVDAMSAEDVRNSMIDTITPAVKRSTEFVAFLDNAGLEKLAKWFFSPPLKRCVTVAADLPCCTPRTLSSLPLPLAFPPMWCDIVSESPQLPRARSAH